MCCGVCMPRSDEIDHTSYYSSIATITSNTQAGHTNNTLDECYFVITVYSGSWSYANNCTFEKTTNIVLVLGGCRCLFCVQSKHDVPQFAPNTSSVILQARNTAWHHCYPLPALHTHPPCIICSASPKHPATSTSSTK